MYLFISSKECKKKWKIMDSTYIGNLNTKTKSGSKADSKKEYYPFIRNRLQERNIKTQNTVIGSSQEAENIASSSSNIHNEYHDIASPPETPKENRNCEIIFNFTFSLIYRLSRR